MSGHSRLTHLHLITKECHCALVVLVCYLLNMCSATVKLFNLFDVNTFSLLHFQTFFFQKLPKTTFKIFNWNWYLQ